MNLENKKIAILGLGYVGLPLAVEFGKKFKVLGFDINSTRIEELSSKFDRTHEISDVEIESSKGLIFSNNQEDLKDCDVYIVTVPTPIDKFKTPNISILLNATNIIAKYLSKGNIVIYESTVYPGCTEDECVPILEKISGLRYNSEFFCGYSPERINPGDKINTLTKIVKVTSGSTPQIASIIDDLYKSIITAGTFKTTSIKVAEASKAIENTQRDLNIAFVNELSIIFDKMEIDTTEVIEAASTKWNFLKYKPGLVGGHCIGVDPYYLAFKAKELGYYPQVILSGRRVNDNMGQFIANKVIKLMIRKGILINNSKVLILGFAFKENCSDIRNSKVFDIYNELLEYGINVNIYDPIVNNHELFEEYKITSLNKLEKYDCVILGVAHDIFKELEITDLLKDESSVIFDVKSFYKKEIVDGRL